MLHISAKTSALRPLHHFWNECVGAGRACEGLRADWQEHMALAVKECGFRYVRFHGLFHDDMFVYREVEGRSIYNFQYVDQLFDRLLEIGIRPFVELGFCPRDLARTCESVFWWKGHGSPPKDHGKWAELVRRTMQNFIDRYGIEEVRTWYFEVWNEPNLRPFFVGTRSEYFELYRLTVKTIKAIDPHLRVGGPATSNFVPDARFAGEVEDASQHAVVVEAKDLNALDWQPVWLAEFLLFCQREALPVDFISCHPYPTDWALDSLGQLAKSTRGIDATPRDLALLRRIVDASPFPHAEIHLTEWSSSPSPRDHTHDHVSAAVFIVKTNLESIGKVNSLSYWTFTDVFEEGGAGDEAFHGGFGMITLQGVVKPSFHAYRFLGTLGDQVVGQAEGIVVTRHQVNGKHVALAYHYPPEEPLSVPASFDTRDVAEATLRKGRSRTLPIHISELEAGAAFEIETLDADHGNAISAWHELGRPHSPSRAQIAELLDRAWGTRKQVVHADERGLLALDLLMQPWSLARITER